MNFPFQPFDKNADFSQPRRRLPHRTQPGCTYFITWRLADSVPREVLDLWKQERGEFYQLHPQPWDSRIQRAYDDRFPRRMERWADAGHGACHLRELHLREIIVDAFHHHDAQHYDLDSYVIMPNHVHVLFTPRVESDAELQPAIQCDAGLQPAMHEDNEPCEMDSLDEGQTEALLNTEGGQTKALQHANEGQTKALPHVGRAWSLSWIMQHWKGSTSFQINKALGRCGTLWMDESFDHAVRSELQLERFRRYIRENPMKAGLKEGSFSLWQSQSAI